MSMALPFTDQAGVGLAGRVLLEIGMFGFVDQGLSQVQRVQLHSTCLQGPDNVAPQKLGACPLRRWFVNDCRIDRSEFMARQVIQLLQCRKLVWMFGIHGPHSSIQGRRKPVIYVSGSEA